MVNLYVTYGYRTRATKKIKKVYTYKQDRARKYKSSTVLGIALVHGINFSSPIDYFSIIDFRVTREGRGGGERGKKDLKVII